MLKCTQLCELLMSLAGKDTETFWSKSTNDRLKTQNEIGRRSFWRDIKKKIFYNFLSVPPFHLNGGEVENYANV